MPSTSAKQARFMAAVAHSPKFAKKVGVPMSVGKEFNQADKGRSFKESDMKGKKMMAAGGSAGNGITKAKMGGVRTAAPSKDGIASKGKTKGTMVKMGAAKPLGMKRGGKC